MSQSCAESPTENKTRATQILDKSRTDLLELIFYDTHTMYY